MGPQRSALKKHRTRIDKFLLDELEQGEVQDLTWMNKAQGIFQVPWVHGSIKNFDIHQDRSLQMRYEVFRGKQPWIYTADKLKKMKPRFRCVLNKSRTVKRIQNEVAPAKSGQPPFKIYSFVNWPLVYDAPNYEQIPCCDILMENNVVDVGMPGEYDEFILDVILSMSPGNNEGLFANAQPDVGAHDAQIMQLAPWAEQMLHEQILPMEQIHVPITDQVKEAADNVPNWNALGMSNIEEIDVDQAAPCAEQMLHEQFLPMEQIHATMYEAAPLEPGRLGFLEVIPPDLTDQVPEPMLPPSPFMEYVKMDFGSYASSPFEECLFGLNDN